MNLNITWDEVTLIEYEENLTDSNRKQFKLTPQQEREYKITDASTNAEITAIIDDVFLKSKIDAIKFINFYTHNRIELIGGYTLLKSSVQDLMRLAVYKQIEFTQLNRGNTVEIQDNVSYNQGSQTNINVQKTSNLYSSDSLCLESKSFIARTGILNIYAYVWWRRITDVTPPSPTS